MGLTLWEFYNRCMLRSMHQYGGLLVSYDALLDRTQTLPTLLRALRDRGIACKPEASGKALDSNLKHHNSLPKSADWSLATASQITVHEYFESMIRSDCTLDESMPPAPILDDERVLSMRLFDYSKSMSSLAKLRETELERDDALALIEERTLERDRSLSALSELESDHDLLVEAHKSEQVRHKRAAESLGELTRDHESLAAAHKTEVKRHEALASNHQQLWQDFAGVESELNQTTEKANFLFYSLTAAFESLLTFEHSTMAKVQRQARRIYRLLTWQLGRPSAYENLLGEAHEHFSTFEIPHPLPPASKLRMVRSVLAYIVRNPAGSLRSLSWSRFRRAMQVFFKSSPDDLAVWVNARFPGAADTPEVFDPKALGPELDFLVLEFPVSADPRVSIIVPVYNDYRVTINCLKTVLEHTAGISYELLIADDHSDDLTATIDDRVHGIKVIRTSENLRFLRNCNAAAEQARGEFTVFLNNDTAVTEGWLESLLEPFVDPEVGIAGPKLLFADGKLQEAGGIIWRDASGWNYGRGDDPKKPAYNYRRDVDYVSGACLAIRRTVWESVGGFDERFAPAYYEDADICFAARDQGHRVVYQPQSQIYHFEGVSNGTDLSSGVKKHQVTNQGVFREKWATILDAYHYPNGEQIVNARDRSRPGYSVLFIDHYVPHHDKDAGSRSTFMYVKLLLGMGCRVQFMGANFFPHEPYTRQLQDLGVEVLVGEHIARNLEGWFSEHAPFIDEVFLHRPHVAEQFLPTLNKLEPRPFVSFVGHDLHYLRMQRQALVSGSPTDEKEAQRWKKRELAVLEQVDRACYFSQTELDELEQYVDRDRLRRIPLYAIPVRSIPAYTPGEPRSMLFVGGYNHPPNVDAAVWLVTEVLPALRDSGGDVEVHIVGSNPPQSINDLAGHGVTVHGYLSDEALDTLYRQVAVAVVPLRFGAGVKGKVIEAIAQGVPLVTTSVGAEGIPDAELVMSVADEAESFAHAVREVFEHDIDLSGRLARYQDWLNQHFSDKTAAQSLLVDRPRLQNPADRVPHTSVSFG
ncbi:MAG: glycosyltransferase [Pseudomonadota bacterium]